MIKVPHYDEPVEQYFKFTNGTKFIEFMDDGEFLIVITEPGAEAISEYGVQMQKKHQHFPDNEYGVFATMIADMRWREWTSAPIFDYDPLVMPGWLRTLWVFGFDCL